MHRIFLELLKQVRWKGLGLKGSLAFYRNVDSDPSDSLLKQSVTDTMFQCCDFGRIMSSGPLCEEVHNFFP